MVDPRSSKTLEVLVAGVDTTRRAIARSSRGRGLSARSSGKAICWVVGATNAIFGIRRLRKFVIRTDANAASLSASIPDDIPVAGVAELAFARGVIRAARITARDSFGRQRRLAPCPRRRQRDRGGRIVATRNLRKLPSILTRIIVPHEVFGAKLEFEIRSATEADIQCVKVGCDKLRSVLTLKANLTFPWARETIDRRCANPIPVGHARVLAEELNRELLRV